jgi:hypothetical protein
MDDNAIYLGESYSLSIIVTDGKITGFLDNVFKKKFEFNEDFESLRKVEISESMLFDAVSDKRDRIVTIAP